MRSDSAIERAAAGLGDSGDRAGENLAMTSHMETCGLHDLKAEKALENKGSDEEKFPNFKIKLQK